MPVPAAYSLDMRFLLSINFCGAMISARCSSFPYDDQECMARSLSLQNLTAIRPEIVIDSSNPANNAVVFQLYNPATGVSGECAAHGATLSPDPAVGKPELWYGCFVESRDATISAGFRFDSPGNQLTVKETWTCVSADSGGL